MILLIDNYDSFVYNLARYFERLGQETLVLRNDAVDVSMIRKLCPQAIVISPGPCTPEQAGCSLQIVKAFLDQLPLLGICLGHQAIAAALGAEIVRSDQPMHGRTSSVTHDGRGVFAGIASPMTVCRYHSLIVQQSSLPSCLEVSARTQDDIVMAFRHRSHPVVGLQFHPESILTNSGYMLLAGFLKIAGLTLPTEIPRIEQEFHRLGKKSSPVPDLPVTF